MAEIFGVAAASLQIAECCKSVTRFISDVTNDTSHIGDTLLHFKNTIVGIAKVFEDVKNTIKDQGSSDSDSLITILSDSGQHCADLLEKLRKQLPELSEDAGVKQRLRAAFTRKLNEKVIQELVGFLDRSGNLENHDYDRLKGNIDKFRETATREPSVHDPDIVSVGDRRECRATASGQDDVPSEVLALLADELPMVPQHDDEVKDLEARGLFLQAANVNCLGQSHEVEMEHEERRADLLIKCATVRLHQRALGILQGLWDSVSQSEEESTYPARMARLGSKLARLLLDSQRLGHFTDQQRGEDLVRARDVLNKSLGVLMAKIQTLRPFPCDTILVVGELMTHLLEEMGQTTHASNFAKVFPKRLQGGLTAELGPIPSDWPRTFESSSSKALDWCKPDNLKKLEETWPESTAVATRPDGLNSKFEPRSSDFRFDEMVGSISPLHLAVIYGKEKIVAEMLSEVEDVDVGNPGMSTPLMEAARNGRKDIARTLLTHNASVECVDERLGRTVLHWAQTTDAHNGVDVSKLFLRDHAGSLLEKEDANGKTALYLACEAVNTEMVDLLVNKYHANVDVQDKYRKTALHTTVDATDRLDERFRIARILLQAGADPNTSDNRDHTPLCIAAYRGHVKIVRLLLEHKADPNRPGHEDRTPLIAATRRKHVDVVKALMRSKADPHAEDPSGRSALDYAGQNPAASEINLLLCRSSTLSQRKDSRASTSQSLAPTRSNTTTTSTPSTQTSSSQAGETTLPSRSGRWSLDAASTGSSSRTSRS
ncbi:ankyrin repeat-containing domain protein [Apiospora rasikravindrae]|uniref:Ankyrin repeat-containing domain protein n=1 Tax=Apiospora rasikravindrae TaxID=990691 RepID=A0ABR1TW48_9PEZI